METTSANLAVAMSHATAGISVFACGQDKKPKPGLMWRNSSTTNPATIRWWWKTWPDAIVGIDLAKSGLIVVDTDRHDPAKDGVAALAELESQNDVLPNHPLVFTRGNGQHHYFVNSSSLGNGRGALPDGIDIRGNGGYVIAGGCVTNEGKWSVDEYAPDLIESRKANTIPELPEWLAALIRAPRIQPALPVPTEATHGIDGRERAFALAALEGCHNELAGITEGDRNNRLNAIAFRLGRMVGRGWVSESDVIRTLEIACERNGLMATDKPKQVRATIRSGLNKGKLRPHEDLRGELENVRHVQIVNGVKCDEDGEVIEDEEPTSQDPGIDSPELERLTYCDGLIGDIVDWIVSTARRPNRVFALGAAVSVLGTLIGRRVAGPTNSATHLYVLGIGPTGAGKGTPINRSKDLLFAAGAPHLIGPGRFTTGPAVSYHIENNPLSLCCQDEFGSFIGRVNHKNASSWETEVSIMYRELWSLSFERYDGMQWANRDRKVIHAPALSIFGLSTPAQFFDALKSGDLTNGFVNRFLVLPGKKQPRNKKPAIAIIPDSIREQLTLLYPWRGSALDVSDGNPNHIPVPDVKPWASRAAEQMFEDFEEHIDNRIDGNEHLENFLERTAEMAVRLATIRAAGRNIGNYDFTVDRSDIEWGCLLSETAGNLLVRHAGDMMGDPNMMLVRELIKKSNGIKHSDLLKSVYKKGIKSKQIKEILETFDEAKSIRTDEEKAAKGRPARTYYWIGKD